MDRLRDETTMPTSIRSHRDPLLREEVEMEGFEIEEPTRLAEIKERIRINISRRILTSY